MPMTRTFQCYDCQHHWTLPYGTGRPAECPQCQGRNFCRLDAERGGAGAAGVAGPGGRCRCGQPPK
jgi:hypothetical protein